MGAAPAPCQAAGRTREGPMTDLCRTTATLRIGGD